MKRLLFIVMFSNHLWYHIVIHMTQGTEETNYRSFKVHQFFLWKYSIKKFG